MPEIGTTPKHVMQNCPLSYPPKAIVELGNAAILSYFKIEARPPRYLCMKGKLIMVGEP